MRAFPEVARVRSLIGAVYVLLGLACQNVNKPPPPPAPATASA
jgi:hypothetical protein